MDELRENYWRTISRTRVSGRIAQGVKAKTEKAWEQFDEDVVREALRIHIDRYPNYKETYTTGIMRNLQRAKNEHLPAVQKPSNSFNSGMQSDYDMDQLEKQILANQ
ncbi:MAG: hypothetical protein K2I96_12165 [Lachnospiraceae bacterium]|nr:hypothetical protein [Lachnospiraceae bacterium]